MICFAYVYGSNFIRLQVLQGCHPGSEQPFSLIGKTGAKPARTRHCKECLTRGAADAA